MTTKSTTQIKEESKIEIVIGELAGWFKQRDILRNTYYTLIDEKELTKAIRSVNVKIREILKSLK